MKEKLSRSNFTKPLTLTLSPSDGETESPSSGLIFSAVLLLALSFGFSDSQAQVRRRADGEKPAPDSANVKYGPHERNVLDLWKAKSDKPTPLLVFIHGGGFSAGNKETLARDAGLTAVLSPGFDGRC